MAPPPPSVRPCGPAQRLRIAAGGAESALGWAWGGLGVSLGWVWAGVGGRFFFGGFGVVLGLWPETQRNMGLPRFGRCGVGLFAVDYMTSLVEQTDEVLPLDRAAQLFSLDAL